MKRIVYIIAAAACVLSGCSKAAFPDDAPKGEYTADAPSDEAPASADDAESYTAIVTVKQDDGGHVCFQLDDAIRLYPVNYPEPFTRQCRIICGLTVWEGNQCMVHWMDYLQEGAVQSGFSGNDDGVDVLEDWMTSVEDGYFTLHYQTLWGQDPQPHTLLLVPGEEDPFQLRLIHLRNGDEALERADALIYFDLDTALPSTGGVYQPLTLTWKNGAGETATKTFSYRSRQ